MSEYFGLPVYTGGLNRFDFLEVVLAAFCFGVLVEFKDHYKSVFISISERLILTTKQFCSV